MKEVIKKCDIKAATHDGEVQTIKIDVIFDQDQEDGKLKCEPYLCNVTIEICKLCKNFMFEKRRYIYAYGAMGYNEYFLDQSYPTNK